MSTALSICPRGHIPFQAASANSMCSARPDERQDLPKPQTCVRPGYSTSLDACPAWYQVMLQRTHFRCACSPPDFASSSSAVHQGQTYTIKLSSTRGMDKNTRLENGCSLEKIKGVVTVTISCTISLPVHGNLLGAIWT